MHVDVLYGAFWTIFFSCLVCRLLGKKKEWPGNKALIITRVLPQTHFSMRSPIVLVPLLLREGGVPFELLCTSSSPISDAMLE